MANKLYSLTGVEIFRTGTWHGKSYTDGDINNIISAFEEFKSSWFRPAVKDGHHREPGKPALGYIDSLRKMGSVLVADIVEMPKKVFDAITAHQYDRVSVELSLKYKRHGKVYPVVLNALSILGVEIPEVDGLKPLREVLSTEEGEWENIDVNLKLEEDPAELDFLMDGVDPEGFAVWSTAFINELPDVAFAVISSGGVKDDGGRTTPRSLRHLPHHNINVKSASDNASVDLPHLRNALARLPQTDLSPAEKAKAQTHLERHAKALLQGGLQGMSIEDDKKAEDEKMRRTKKAEADKNFKKKEDEEMEIKEYEAKLAAMKAELEDAKKKAEDLEKLSTDAKTIKVKTLVENLSETQGKLSTTMEEFSKAQKEIAELKDSQRLERVTQKVQKLRVPALRFFAEQFYDWATKEGERVISFTQDGVKKEKLAEQIVDEFCLAINKATDNLFIQQSKVDTFKRDDTPADENPRVEVDNRVKAYQAEHPEVDYGKAMDTVFALDPELKEAYARS